MQDFSRWFYLSTQWRELSYITRLERKKCERCSKVFDDIGKLIAHHKIEVTPENIYNPQITLNKDNIEVLCTHCHNKEHKRFGNKQEVIIVWGSPLSGKNTYIAEQMVYGDVIVDIDEIWKSLSGQDKYIKPNNIRYTVFKAHRDLLEQIKQRNGDWYTAWVIMATSDEYEVKRKAKELGAEIVFIEATKDECIKRCEGRPAEWLKYVNDWWEEYES